jgi:nucleoside-diphosphate-sugar epimerase
MHALVTGGSGYFGSTVVQKLRDRGHKVTILDVNDSYDRPKDVQFLQYDIRDKESVSKACIGKSVVFHNVAQVPLAKDIDLFWSVNRDGTKNILEGCIKAGVEKLVYTSSSAVFGVPKKNPVTETTEPTPGEDYGRAKLAGELLCEQYSRDHGLSVSIIRPRTILGHGRLGIFQILFDWVSTGHNVPVMGNGSNVYQFVHSDDLAEACILAANKTGYSVYNCGAYKFGTMREVLEALCKHAGTGSRVRNVPMWPAVIGMKMAHALKLSPLGPYHALMYGRSLYFDTTKAQQELGWIPRYSNDDMMIESYDWYLRNRESLKQEETVRSHHRSGVKQGMLSLVKALL